MPNPIIETDLAAVLIQIVGLQYTTNNPLPTENN